MRVSPMDFVDTIQIYPGEQDTMCNNIFENKLISFFKKNSEYIRKLNAKYKLQT